VSLWAELRRRSVFRVGIAYLAVTWLSLQVADVVLPILEAPEWLLRALFFSALLGFPLALVLAWFYELTPDGIKVDSEAEAIESVGFLGRRLDFAIIGLLVLAIGFLVADKYVFEEQTPAGLSDFDQFSVHPNSVAVLPFLNIGGDEEGRIFSDGLAEDVINRLATVPDLRISSRGDSFSLMANSPSEDVRRRLRVAYYIEGSIRVVGDTMRVVVQLIDSEDGFHVFSRSFDRPHVGFFALQDEITSLTVANLRVAIPGLTQSAVETVFDETDDLDVYLSYRAGMDALRRPRTEETIDEALEAFRRALSFDPGFAAAHAGSCMTYLWAYRGFGSVGYVGEAERSCAAALALNPNLDVVHNALGDLYSDTGRHEEAEAAYERAFELNESSVDSLIGLGFVYQAQQRPAEAEDALTQAIGLQPGNWNSYNALGRYLFQEGRYADSAQAYAEIVSLDSSNFSGWTNLGTSLMLSGDLSEAVVAFERALEIEKLPTTYISLGLLHYYLSEFPEAITALENAVEITPDDRLAWSNLGDVLLFSSESERAAQAFATAERLAESQLEINGRDALVLIDLAWIKAMLGNFDEAQDLIMQALEVAPEDPYVHYIDGLVLVQRGDHSAAISSLETAIEKGFPIALMAAEPHLETLLREPRFQGLIGEVPVR